MENDYPEIVEVDGIDYPINTDFRFALECLDINENPEIDGYERSIAFVTILFGEECPVNDLSVSKAVKYLECGRSKEEHMKQKPDVSFEQDMKYIRPSFTSNYGINLSIDYLHYYDFYEKLEALEPNTILSRIRDLRNYDESEIKDSKSKRKIREAKKRVEIKPKAIKRDSSKRDEFFNQLRK